MGGLLHRVLLLGGLLLTNGAIGEEGVVEIQKVTPGPWGELEYFPLILEPPDRQVAAIRAIDARQPRTEWKLPGFTRDTAADLLRETGVPDDAIEKLTRAPFLQVIDDKVTIYPPSGLVESLTPEIRGRLYPRIGTAGGKTVFADFFVIEKDGFTAMAKGSGLRQPTIDLISNLTYAYQGILVFSDIRLVMERVEDEPERRRILKTLLRERSLSLRLKLSNGNNLSQLDDYWSARGRRKEILPILESVAKTEGVERLDIAHLLPPTPRKLLHTYADPLMGVGKALPDCYWTAFNFFSYEASNRHFDPTAFRRRLEERYETATPPRQLGDLVLIYDTISGIAHHACSHIAGDIVFTKNGSEVLRPWVLTKLEEVVGYYTQTDRVGVAWYRLKPGIRE